MYDFFQSRQNLRAETCQTFPAYGRFEHGMNTDFAYQCGLSVTFSNQNLYNLLLFQRWVDVMIFYF